HPEKSGLFLYLNANKRGVTLNLKTEAGREVFKRLVREADILVENFAPRVMSSLGLSYEILREINPGLVMTSISNFGQTGPYRDYQATELVLQAMSGLMSFTGDRDKAPLRYSLNQAQYLAGASAAGATLMAQYSAEMVGQGQQIDISIVEALASTFHTSLGQYSYVGTVVGRSTNNMFRCKDGYVVANIGEQVTWDYYVAFLGALDLVDERFQTPAGRLRHQDEVDRALQKALAARGRYEWMHDGQANGMAFAAMLTMEDLPEDPQLACRAYWVETEHAEAGSFPFPGRPYKMSESPFLMRRPAPRLGEHNAELFGELGYSAKDLASLRALQAI
ncbi:MAG: CoA transferase, partial [Dehalococcoidia bacterium]|nr:CoA transferase [Dehalococcoidia bacterium]